MYLSNLATSDAPLATPTRTLPTAQWVEVPLAAGGVELKLWGKFPPRWLANLTGGLAAKGVNIQKGYANKLSPTVWQGIFEMSRSGGGAGQALDYVSLAQHGENSAAAAEIALDFFDIKPSDEALYVEIRGDDTVGFLMSLLKTFAYCSLYPAEVSIDTPAGKVHDRFWLKGLGGGAPSPALAEGLHHELRKLRR